MSSAARYGIKAVLDIANNSDGARITTREISERQKIPRVFLTKIIERLVNVGLLTSQRGAGGGVALARPVHEITLMEIVEAIDGPLKRTACLIRPDECEYNQQCPIYNKWNAIQDNVADLLKKHTLDGMVCGEKPIPQRAPEGTVYA